MADVALWVLSTMFDVFVLTGPSAERRTNEAYRAAWKARAKSGDESIEVLRESFKQHSAPGAYADPDGEPLRPWLDAWREGRKPRNAGRQVKKMRKGV